jgi:hypothetical protein
MPTQGEYAGQRPYELASEKTKEIFHVFMFEQIAMDNEDAISRLLAGGVSPDLVDDSHEADSLLHWACSFGSAKVAAVLLSNGCNVSIRNGLGQTPLHLACKNKHLPLVRLLLEEGASPACRDYYSSSSSSSPRPGAGDHAGGAGGREGKGDGDGDGEGRSPKDLLPGDADPALAALLDHPPEPSFALGRVFQKAQEERAALKQLQLQKSLLSKQTSSSNSNSNSSSGAAAALEGGGAGGEEPLEDSLFYPSDFEEDDGDVNAEDYNDSGDNNDDDENKRIQRRRKSGSEDNDLLLIFWPPVKKQKYKKGATSLTLRNNVNLLISVASSDIDIFPLLTWSGLMEVLDGYGFQVQVKRSSAGARIRLCIDRNVCPTANSYELQVCHAQICITAGDATGLLYGVYTLIQLFKLHSDPTTSAAGVAVLVVPAISISDKPDVAQRAVLWSYREQVRCNTYRMQEQIELLSRLRFNMLFLVIDPVKDTTVSVAGGGVGSGGGSGNVASSSAAAAAAAAVIEASNEVSSTCFIALW